MIYRYKEQSTFFCSSNDAFQIIIDVKEYPNFIPWCKAVYIEEKTDNQMIVNLLVAFRSIKGKYTSEVTFLSPNKTNEGWIEAVSTNGIFKHLYNKWKFIPINKNKTMVKFYIEFELKPGPLSALLNSAYKYIQSKIIIAFKERVESLTGYKVS